MVAETHTDTVSYTMPESSFAGVVSPCVDADHLNAIMNADGVKEFMRLPDGVDDISALIGKVLFLANDHGFIAVESKAPQCYSFHTAILPKHRGRDGYKLARAAAEYMFLNTDALELHTYTPFDNPNAKPPKTFGFKHWFNDKDGEYYRASLMDWAKLSPNLMKWGEWFHECLEDQASVHLHDEDVSNNRYAGLSCGMMKAGNIAKAIWAYNHWAITAGYHPIELTSVDPVTIFTGDAHIRIESNTMEFLPCL